MSEQLNQILSEQLRDVHLPEPVSWWPLAIGWWVLIALLLVALIALLSRFLKRRAKNKYRHQALKELTTSYSNWQQDADASAYLQSANTILKRSVLAFSDNSVNNRLSGQAWVDALNTYSKQTLLDETQTALSIDCYQVNPSSDIELVHRDVMQWLKAHQHHAQKTDEVQHA